MKCNLGLQLHADVDETQVDDVLVGLLEYQEAITVTQAASKGLASHTDFTAANTPASPIQGVKPPQTFIQRE